MKESNIGTSLILLNRSWSWIGNLASQRRHKVPMACYKSQIQDHSNLCITNNKSHNLFGINGLWFLRKPGT